MSTKEVSKNEETKSTSVALDMKFEVVVIPVSDVDRAKQVYSRLGWRLPRRSWTEQTYPKLIHFNKPPRGGHSAAWEQPKLFSEEVRAGFRSLR